MRRRDYSNYNYGSYESNSESPREKETIPELHKEGTAKCLLKVRSQPTETAGVVRILNIGDKVEITGEVGKYYQVLDEGGHIVYVMKNFIGVS